MSSTAKYLTGNNEGIKEFIDKFDVFLFDCDGVLWSGDHLFEGTVETLEMLRSKGKQIIFVTNNSTKSRADYRQKLVNMGIPATTDEVFSSSYSAAIYISRILNLPPSKNKVFVLGESGIEQELTSEGILYIGGRDPSLQRPIEASDYTAIADGSMLDPSVGVVLAGLDFHMNYLKFALAYHYIQQNGAVFLATNIDVTLPSASSLFPGAGACTAPLAAMLGKQPLSLGKPSQALMEAVEGKFRFERSRACMVGDRLDTDIRFGVEGRLGGTLCVMTGVTRSVQDWEGGEVVPSSWVDTLGDLRGVA